MSNIRTLADLRREDEEREKEPIIGDKKYNQSVNSINSDNSEFNPNSTRSLPIKFLELLFPYITWKSVLLVITVTQWALYIAMLCIDSEMPLVPSGKILSEFGANIPPEIKKGQVWRLICPVFLHANFVHIIFNTFFQMRMGFTIEKKYGIPLFIVLYFFTAIIGNAFSAAIFFCDRKVGASTAGFGMIGLQMAELMLYYHLMRHRERVLMNVLIFVVLMTLMMFTFSGGNIDQMGHVGGCVAGISLGILFNWNMEQKPRWFHIGQAIAILVLLSISVISFTLIFVLHRTCF